nr:hypothetical protein [Salinispora arenicola]
MTKLQRRGAGEDGRRPGVDNITAQLRPRARQALTLVEPGGDATSTVVNIEGDPHSQPACDGGSPRRTPTAPGGRRRCRQATT